jgi:NADPH:quinone reductase-like Zn-dependent oxidoreductase
MAVRLFEYGGPENLVSGEPGLLPLGEHDVSVKVLAAAVLHREVKYRAGHLARYQNPDRAAFSLSQQLGRGDALQAEPTRDRCPARRGFHNLVIRDRSYAQYLVRHESMLLPLSDGVDYEQPRVTLWYCA